MISRLVFLLFCGHFAQILGNAGKLPRVKKQSLKVQINVTNDAVCMRYIRPTPSTKLEGFILGYGSSFFSNQYIPLPSNGKMYITEIDAEPRYLIVVRPNNKKSCSGKTKTHKPLQLVIGTLTPTSVFLSWGILVNPKHDWTTMNNCPNDRFYTVRYREKDKNKRWNLQLCPTTETVVDNLKPNTIYEFGVKDNTDDGIWSKSFIHKVVIPGKNKENGQLQNNYKFPKIQTQFIPDSKTLVPVQVIKQVLQNITHRTQSEILQRPPLSGPILVHLIVPDFNATKQKPPSSSRLDIFEKTKQILAKNKTQEWLPESKISEVKEITPQSQTDLEKSKPTAAGVSKDSTVNQAHTESELESSKPSKAPMTEMPPVTLDLQKFLGLPKAKPSPTPHMPTGSSALTNEPTLESFPSKTSKTLDWPRETLVSTLPSMNQNIPKTSRITEKLKASPEKESQEKTTASSIFKTPELPRTTMVTNKLIPLPTATKISVTDGHPVPTMASYKPSPVPPKFKEPEYIFPEVPDRKHVSTEDDNYLPKILTTAELPITKSVPYESSPVPSKFKEPDYIMIEVPDRKPASYKPSPVPPKFKEPENIMPEVPDRKHVSTEDDNYRPKVLTVPELPITKSVSTKDDNYLPKVLTTPELSVTKPASYKSSPVPPKFKEPEHIMPEVPDKKHVSAEDDNYLSKVLTTPELLITESASYKPRPVPSKFKEPENIMAEVPDRKQVSTEHGNYLPKALTTTELPITKPASYKPRLVRPKFKEPENIMPEVPDRKHVSTEDDNYLPKALTTTEGPNTKPVSYEPSPVPSTFKEPSYIPPAVPDTKHVSTEDGNYLSKALTTPELLITESASYKPRPVPPKFKEPENVMAEVPDRKQASYESSRAPSKFKEPDYLLSEVPDRKHVLEPITFSNELPIVDAKTKHHISTTKTTINPLLLPKSDVEEVIFKTEQAKSSTAPKETHRAPTRPKTSSSSYITPTKSSLNVKHHEPSKPKSPPGQKTQQSKPDPKETQLLPSKPKPSDKQERNKTKPASSKLNNKVTVTKIPHLKKVVYRTTPAPPRTRTSGGSSWSKKPRVATLPGSPRPPLAPARPTPIRRKPLPPNNVTGKPGHSGNVLMPRASSFLTTSIAKPTWPSSLVKTNSPKKLPTAAASPDYDNPMFSSIPTSETDIAGTPRYTGDHVKYMKKKDDEPCSITNTLQHFPSDVGDNRDMATSAPQKPPTNLTVVTVEGCPSFVVLGWKKPENETVTEYKVVSTENGGTDGKDKCIITTNQTHSTVENLKPNTSYEFVVIPSNPLGEGPSSESKPFRTESADPRVTESISMGKDAIWTEVSFNSDDYSECKGKQYVKRTWYKKFVGVQLCNSLRYKIYLSDTLTGTFYNIGDQRGHGEDHCQFVDSYFDGKTGQMLPSHQLPTKDGYFRAVRQEPVHFGKIGAGTHSTYVHWYECGTTIPGKW